jgi:protein ImuB
MVRFDDAVGGGVSILGWVGPWPCDERWWDQRTHRRRARLQLALADGRALLVQIEQGSWSVEAIYD